MIKNKIGIGIFLIVLLVSMVFVPAVSAEKLAGETNDNVLGTHDNASEIKSLIEQIPPTDPSILNKRVKTKMF